MGCDYIVCLALLRQGRVWVGQVNECRMISKRIGQVRSMNKRRLSY